MHNDFSLDSNNLFRIITDNTTIGIVVSNQQGSFIYANNAFCKLIGYTLGELQGLTFFDITHPDCIKKNHQISTDLIENKIQKYVIEKKYIAKNGEIIHCETTVTAKRNEADEFEYFVAHVHDISERIKQYNALVQSELNYKNLIETTSDFIWTVNADDYKTVSFNTAIAHYFREHLNIILYPGISLDALQMSNTSDWVNFYEKAKELGRFETIYELSPRNIFLHISFFTQKVAGKISTISAIGRNITQQILSERELKVINIQLEEKNAILDENVKKIQEINNSLKIAKAASERISTQLQIISANLPAFIAQVNTNLEYVFVNKFFELYTKKSVNELLGHSMHEILGSKIMPMIQPMIQRVLAGETCNFEAVYDSGTVIADISTNYIPYIENGKVIGFFIFGHDISERKLIEKDLIQAKNKAEESVRLKTAFLNNISHEVRTPLNGILGFTQLLAQKHQTSEKRQRYLDYISTSTDKLIGIISDVIDISQIQAQSVEIKLLSFNLCALIQEIILDFKPRFDAKDIAFHVNSLLLKGQYFIISDVDKMMRILRILLENALKFTENGEVLIEFKENSQTYTLSVSDSGIGIAPEMQTKLFEPFQQIYSVQNRISGGNGLGLAIVKAYVEMLNGKIILESQPNVGTQVHLEFPKKGSQNAFLEQFRNTNTRPKIVLAVEPSAEARLQISDSLAFFDVQIIFAANGLEALDICRNQSHIDLVLMSINMPVMDGRTAIRLIKQFRADLPILAYTTEIISKKSEFFITPGFDDLISQSQSKDDMLKLLKHYGFRLKNN